MAANPIIPIIPNSPINPIIPINPIPPIAAAHSPAERAALEIVWRLRHTGYRAYWAGGCVRDRLLGIAPADIDIATDARPHQITALFPNVLLVGAKFGVCVVTIEGVQTEVATFRREGAYEDHRHPGEIEFAGPAEDALRRDFTINAMFWDPVENNIIDYVDGQEDLARRILRCVGGADARMSEDALRVLRAMRFAARLDFEIESQTREALARHAPSLRLISPERIRDELLKMLCGPNRVRALDLLEETGALEIILPEAAAMRGVEQPEDYHPEGDVWRHTRLCLELIENPTPTLVMAALLHDIGKPPTMVHAADRIRFNGHASVGANMAESICRRLKFTNQQIEAIKEIINRHMVFADIENMRPSTLTRFLAAPNFDELLELHRADCLASHGALRHYEFASRKLAEARAACPDILPPPIVVGRDLIEWGYQPGPLFTRILAAARDRQLDGKMSTPEEAKDYVLNAFPLNPPLPGKSK